MLAMVKKYKSARGNVYFKYLREGISLSSMLTICWDFPVLGSNPCRSVLCNLAFLKIRFGLAVIVMYFNVSTM